MPKLSKNKIELIEEHIKEILMICRPLYTSEIAKVLGRDEEFILKIMKALEEKKMVGYLDGSKYTKTFVRRKLWIIEPEGMAKSFPVIQKT